MENSFFTAQSERFRQIEGDEFFSFGKYVSGRAEEILSYTRPNKYGWVFSSLVRVKMPSGCALYLHVGSN